MGIPNEFSIKTDELIPPWKNSAIGMILFLLLKMLSLICRLVVYRCRFLISEDGGEREELMVLYAFDCIFELIMVGWLVYMSRTNNDQLKFPFRALSYLPLFCVHVALIIVSDNAFYWLVLFVNMLAYIFQFWFWQRSLRDAGEESRVIKGVMAIGNCASDESVSTFIYWLTMLWIVGSIVATVLVMKFCQGPEESENIFLFGMEVIFRSFALGCLASIATQSYYGNEAACCRERR